MNRTNRNEKIHKTKTNLITNYICINMCFLAKCWILKYYRTPGGQSRQCIMLWPANICRSTERQGVLQVKYEIYYSNLILNGHVYSADISEHILAATFLSRSFSFDDNNDESARAVSRSAIILIRAYVRWLCFRFIESFFSENNKCRDVQEQKSNRKRFLTERKSK